MSRPKLPAWGYEYALDLAYRLRKKYPKGLTGQEMGVELGLSRRSAVSIMNKHDFHAFDRRWRWEDVAAMLTYRQAMRMKQIHKLV